MSFIREQPYLVTPGVFFMILLADKRLCYYDVHSILRSLDKIVSAIVAGSSS